VLNTNSSHGTAAGYYYIAQAYTDDKRVQTTQNSIDDLNTHYYRKVAWSHTSATFIPEVDRTKTKLTVVCEHGLADKQLIEVFR
jgi:hypothetical protein